MSKFGNLFAKAPVKRYVNVPLPERCIAVHLAYGWWATQFPPLADLADDKGYTAWAGQTITSDVALSRTPLASPHFDLGRVEKNWRHVWDGPHYRSSDVPLHYTTLSQALGPRPCRSTQHAAH